MNRDAARGPGLAGEIQGTLWRFFEGSDTPAAVGDSSLNIVAANHAFGLRVGAQSDAALLGTSLLDLLGMDPEELLAADPGSRLPATLPGGASAMARVQPVGDLYLVTLDAGIEGARLAKATRALQDQERVFSIGRLLSLLMAEEDLVGVVAQGLREFFDGRFFCIRVVDPTTMELTSLYAEGTLIPEERERLTLKRSAVTKTRLPPAALESDRVAVRVGYHGIFEGTETGIGIPLVAGSQLFGMINVEGTEAQFGEKEADERLAIGLANQLSVALRNAKLLREARYLRGYLEKLIENANALILSVDREGRIVVFNRACQELSGYRLDEVESVPLVELVLPEQRQRLERQLGLAMRGRSATNVEFTVLAKDGRNIEVAFNTAPIAGPEGRVESVVAIGNDLTRLIELEQQVIHVEKLASLGQFAAAVVHELNNPLTSIMVYAEALRERLSLIGTDNDVKKSNSIVSSTERILKFTKDLVAYARPSEERRIRVDLREVVEQSVGLCEHVVNERQAVLTQRWEVSLPLVLANRGKLQQVFVNLLTNACHAVEPGGSITMWGEVDGAFAVVVVQDDGHGMPPEIAERVFDPFFSTKAPGRGTGLGLSIVHEIVQRHGGDITVESEPGGGSRFRVRLPVDSPEA